MWPTLQGECEGDTRIYSDPERRLISAVIVRALKDAKRGDIEAKVWLDDPETEQIFLSLADLDRRAVRRVLIKQEVAKTSRRYERCLQALAKVYVRAI